jgi:uncharacterized Zn-finger protein
MWIHADPDGSETLPSTCLSPLCKVISRSYGLQTSFRAHTGEKPYSCLQCTKLFAATDGLRRHLNVHIGEKPFACFLCTKISGESRALQKHLRAHTGAKPYSCLHCEESFSHASTLFAFTTSHSRVRPKVKLFVCAMCTKTFRQNRDLQRHLKVHTSEKPYRCSQSKK